MCLTYRTLFWIALLGLPVAPAALSRQQQEPFPATSATPAVTFESLLREMTDREAVARWPAPEYRLLQASSYDRRSREGDLPSTQPTDTGWFANED